MLEKWIFIEAEDFHRQRDSLLRFLYGCGPTLNDTR